MLIFVTGASGTVGSAVIKTLLGHGHDVAPLVRTSNSLADFRALGCRPVQGDVRQASDWCHVAAQADAIVHAAQPRWPLRITSQWMRLAERIDRAAVRGIIDAAQKGGRCRAFVYTSGITVYQGGGDDWLDENAPKASNAFATHRLEGERLALGAREQGIPTFIMRLGMVCSPRGLFEDYFLRIARHGLSFFPGDGQSFVSSVHFQDLADAFVSALEKAPDEHIFNLVDDEPLRWRDFAEALLDAVGGGRTVSIPKWLLSMAGGSILADSLTQSARISNARAKAVLGWRPRFPRFHSAVADINRPVKSRN